MSAPAAKTRRRIRPQRVIDIAAEDSRPPHDPLPPLEVSAPSSSSAAAIDLTASPAVDLTGPTPSPPPQTRRSSSGQSATHRHTARRKRKAEPHEEEEEAEAEAEAESDSDSERKTSCDSEAEDDQAEEEAEDDEAEEGELEDGELYGSGDEDERKTSSSADALADSSAPPIVPFIFNAENLPTDADRAASDLVVQNRLAQFLSGVELINATTPVQRSRLSKDRLLQRNIEIQAMMVRFDRDYDVLLNQKTPGWELAVRALDEKNDELAEESDEIETLLFEKYRVVGGGRSLLSDEIVQAGEYGANMADTHRQRGLPIPKLSTPAVAPASAIAHAPAAAAASASSSPIARTFSRTAELLLAPAVTEDANMAEPAASSSAATAVPKKQYSAKSRADAAVEQRLEAESDTIKARRATRKEKEKTSLLGQYMAHFDRYVDIDPVAKKAAGPRKPKAVPRPASFPLHLGTLVFPLFRDDALIRAPIEEEVADESNEPLVKLEPTESGDEEKTDSSALAPTPSPSTNSRKRRRSATAPVEEGDAADAIRDTVDPIDVDSDVDSDDEAGEEVWLDFSPDPLFIDGCVVRQVRPTPNAEENNATETVTLGLLPLAGLHPPAPEEPEPELDEQGEPIPSRRTRTKPMPDPSHALAALYILHDANVVRVESTLVRSSASATTAANSLRECVEVTILVNSRIYEQQLLRAIAQKEAMRTLFRIFSEADPNASPQTTVIPRSLNDPALYPNADGVLVPYSELDEAERRVVALSDSGFSLKSDEQTKQEDTGVAAMEIDSDSDDVKPPTPPAAKSSPPIAQASENNKRRKVELSTLSLLDQAIGGEEVGESDEESGDESDEEEHSEYSEDELCDTLVDDHFVFVDLVLPGAEIEADEAAATSSPASPTLKKEDAAAAEEASQVTEEEIASYKLIEKKSAELDGPSPSLNEQLSAEEKQLENEGKAAWRPDTLHTLFESIRPTPAWTKSAAQPPGLVPTLRPFQQKALAWMVERETERDEEYEDPLWEVARLNGRTVYYQPFLGVVQREQPPLRHDVRGGVLAEEMGLGKTIEVIALVLKRPWVPLPLSPRHKAMASRQSNSANPTSADDKPELPQIGATLIVSPMSLVYQWQKEITLHAPTLKVLVYDGTAQRKSPEAAAELYDATMAEFADADVILTNYAVLGSEVNYSKQCHYGFRGAKQYAVPKSPLLDCHFHRVILDEAQMVHSSLSVCFKMASRIAASSRFCVSGTPIGPQGLHDLFGLVSFLGCAEFDSAGTWRSAMRATTPDGLERLRQLLRRIMWRHAKAHVLDEVCIPRLHLNKIYLSFSRVERANYQEIEQQCRSTVFFDTAKGRLEDRTAFKKLETLRQACAHPQASSSTYGKSIKSIPVIGKMMVKRSKDEAAACERDLARAMNKLALEYRRQGQLALAEQTFTESWKIADSGVEEEKSAESESVVVQPAAPSRSRSSATAMASAAEAVLSSSKKLDAFDTDTNIVTQNTQTRQWRQIELVTCYQLACIYREQLKTKFDYVESDLVHAWRETGVTVFEKYLADKAAQAPAFVAGGSSHLTAFEMDEPALPPQLIAAAAAAAASVAPSVDMSSQDSDKPDPLSDLLSKYNKLKLQFDFCMHELFDLFEFKLKEQAHLIALTYEADLLPACLLTSCPEVIELADDRKKVGVEQFNRLSQPYIARIEELLPMLEEEQDVQHIVLEIYDLSRSQLRLKRLAKKLKTNATRHNHHLALMRSLRAERKAKIGHESYYPQATRTVSKSGAARDIHEILDKQNRKLTNALNSNYRKLSADMRRQIEEENDLGHINFDHCQHRQKYDEAWHRSRDSVQALRIMKEVKVQRSKMRGYIQKMLRLRLQLLRDHNIISAGEAHEAITQVLNEVYAEDEEQDGSHVDHTPKARKSKKAKLDPESPQSPISDVDDGFPRAAAASPAASSASPASASQDFVDTDTAISRDDMHESILGNLKSEIFSLQTKAKAIHMRSKWLQSQFGLISASDSAIRGHVCSICMQIIREPVLTVCGHYFDHGCLTKWLKGKDLPSCPTCRRQLSTDDWAAFKADELPALMSQDSTMPQRTPSKTADVSSATIPASAPSSAAAASSSAIVMPTLDEVQRIAIVGEGQHGSKVETICKYIKHLHRTNPAVKVLVFSQYHRMLDLVATALSQNGIQHLHLDGDPKQRAKKIESFQTEPKYTAFLMSLRTDNSGLTLVSATAVFLMEPSLQPNIEAQAVNRIHRIGQKSETHVFKFLMRDSVEQAIDEMATAGQQHQQASTNVPMQTEGEALVHQSKESLSVSQLLTVLQLSDDGPSNRAEDDEDQPGGAASSASATAPTTFETAPWPGAAL